MIKITLSGKKGVDYNAYIQSYFADFSSGGWPYILGGKDAFKGKEIVLLDQIEAKPADTKAMVMDGKGFFYYFTGHTLSGKLTELSLTTLGKSYNRKDGSFDMDKNGLITNVKTAVTFSALDISNPKEVRGDLHKVIYGLMGGEHNTDGISDPSAFFAYVNGQGHKVKGSEKADAYAGTDFIDKINGKGGADVLKGMGGNDIVKGSDGDDTLSGGTGSDLLTGGPGKDNFVFDTAIGADVDTITDFNPKDDSIHLAASVFAGLAVGALNPAIFAVGAAADPDDRLVYDKASGALSFDTNGSEPGGAIQFALLGKNLNLSANDFFVV